MFTAYHSKQITLSRHYHSRKIHSTTNPRPHCIKPDSTIGVEAANTETAETTDKWDRGAVAFANLTDPFPLLLGHVALVRALRYCDFGSCQSTSLDFAWIGQLTTQVRSCLLFEFALLAHRDIVLSLDRGGEGAGEHDAHNAEGELHVDH
jgi:hypothetical protein